ncbi:MAG: hypothetical protein ABI167_08950 [Nitrosospira sp.]
MNKFISTVILATFTAVCSFGVAAAGSDASDKKDAMSQDSSGKPQAGSQYGKEPSSTSDVTKNQMPKDLSPEELKKFKDQESMNKKPYKQ